MEALEKIREFNFNSTHSKFISDTSKQVYKSIPCGEKHSLIREGDEIKVVLGKEPVSYNIDKIPFMLQFACSDKENECYRHQETDAIVCVSKDEMGEPETNKLYKISDDKVVNVEETKDIHTCTHQKMNDFKNGSATIYHKDPKKCGKIYEDSMEVCKNSGSKKCHKQVKLVTDFTDTCKLAAEDSIDMRMAAYPYKSNSDVEEMKRVTPKKDFESFLKIKSSWANSVRKNGKVIAPMQCDTLGAPCGFNKDVYYGQCTIINRDSQPVCKPIMDELELNNAKHWLDSHPIVKSKLKQEGTCKSSFKNLSVCKEFDENKKCIHTIQEYSVNESGSVCNNPYYKKEDTFVCQKNKHTFSGENEYDTHTFGNKIGLNDLRTKCLNMNKGFGVAFYEQENGESVCNILKEKPNGISTTTSGAASGSICLPYE